MFLSTGLTLIKLGKDNKIKFFSLPFIIKTKAYFAFLLFNLIYLYNNIYYYIFIFVA